MATKIYISGNAVIVEGVYAEKEAINPVHFDWQVSGGVYSVRDKIQNQSYSLGLYSNVTNEADVAYASAALLEVALNSFVNSGGSSVDSTTNAVASVDYAHAEIHSGNHYFYTDHVELDDTNTQDYLITAPDTSKWPHIILDVDGSAITQIQLFEATDRVGTTLQTAFNNNRNSSNTAGVTVHKGTSGGTTDGTQIVIKKSGAANNFFRSGLSVRNDNEINLKQNTKYLLRITSGTDANLCNVGLFWYEHTNK